MWMTNLVIFKVFLSARLSCFCLVETSVDAFLFSKKNKSLKPSNSIRRTVIVQSSMNLLHFLI